MLVKPHALFQAALTQGWAIGAFNASQLELAQAIIWAAQTVKSPVIVQTSEGAIEYAGLAVLSGIVRELASQVDVPVILHLDHGKNLDIVRRCIEAGYTSVMIDASKLPLTDNIKVTREVVEVAHARGVWVEAELGAILGVEGARALGKTTTPEAMFTNPSQAAQFVADTGVDALAVSVGTIHGAFTGQEYIRFELLAQLEEVVPNFPLVVHGASGIADEHLHRVAQGNVCKINVDTELRIAFLDAVKAYVATPQDIIDPRHLLGAARSAVEEVVKSKMEIFGSAERAATL